MKSENQPPLHQHVLQPFLTRLLLRSSLSAEEQATVLDLPIRVERIPANVDFVRLGERLGHACLVIDGLVGRFEQTRKGDRQTTALHIPGDMADLHSVVLPKTSWALQALTRIMHRDMVLGWRSCKRGKSPGGCLTFLLSPGLGL